VVSVERSEWLAVFTGLSVRQFGNLIGMRPGLPSAPPSWQPQAWAGSAFAGHRLPPQRRPADGLGCMCRPATLPGPRWPPVALPLPFPA
jgi:hypothetical protein